MLLCHPEIPYFLHECKCEVKPKKGCSYIYAELGKLTKDFLYTKIKCAHLAGHVFSGACDRSGAVRAQVHSRMLSFTAIAEVVGCSPGGSSEKISTKSTVSLSATDVNVVFAVH